MLLRNFMEFEKSTDNLAHASLPMVFGEVLFDCFQDGREVLGGAPFNIAWNLQAFGLSPLFISRVGDDNLGCHIQKKMLSWGMDTRGLQLDQRHPTGKVQIELTEGEPCFTILPDQAYDYISTFSGDLQSGPSFLYHGSLALRNDTSRDTLSLLKQKFKCPIFVDVNLRTPWWNAELVGSLIEDATWLKLNDVELDALFPEPGNLEERCCQILERFELEAVFVTLGKKGAVALNRNKHLLSIKPSKNILIIDTVGAGDAFSSVLLLGLMNKWDFSTTMKRAQEFASAVVGQRGAITLEKDFYQTFSNMWNLHDTF
jgi:fructokinase